LLVRVANFLEANPGPATSGTTDPGLVLGIRGGKGVIPDLESG